MNTYCELCLRPYLYTQGGTDMPLNGDSRFCIGCAIEACEAVLDMMPTVQRKPVHAADCAVGLSARHACDGGADAEVRAYLSGIAFALSLVQQLEGGVREVLADHPESYRRGVRDAAREIQSRMADKKGGGR